MATKPKTQLYMILYKDAHQLYLELTKAQVDELNDAIVEGKRGIVFPEIGALVLSDVRSVIKQNPIEPEPLPEAADPILTREEIEFVRGWKQAGFDIIPKEGVYS